VFVECSFQLRETSAGASRHGTVRLGSLGELIYQKGRSHPEVFSHLVRPAVQKRFGAPAANVDGTLTRPA